MSDGWATSGEREGRRRTGRRRPVSERPPTARAMPSGDGRMGPMAEVNAAYDIARGFSTGSPGVRRTAAVLAMLFLVPMAWSLLSTLRNLLP